MTINGFLIVMAVGFGVLVVETFADKAIGVDLSHLSPFKRCLHCVVYEMAGAAIFAAIVFAL